MSEQLTLSVSLPDDASFENFYPVQNEQLLHALQFMARGRGEHYLFFWGLAGSGCTHLLQAACREMNRLGLPTIYLDLKELVQLASPALFEGLESLHLVSIDNIEAIAGNAEWEEALFYFYNRLLGNGHRLLIASHVAPKNLNLNLKDLSSRLQAGLTFQLKALTDEEKLAALNFRATHKGFDLPDNVAQFLMRHAQRDMKTLSEILEKLDAATLTAQRKLTIPFVKSVLDNTKV